MNSLMQAEHFQVAYATNDIDAGLRHLGCHLNITETRTLQGPLPEGGEIHVELAWVGGVMIELLHAQGPGSSIYQRGVQGGDQLSLSLHHLGFLIESESEWSALKAACEDSKAQLLLERVNSEFMTSCFIEVPGISHLFEYILPSDVGRQFFNEVPRC